MPKRHPTARTRTGQPPQTEWGSTLAQLERDPAFPEIQAAAVAARQRGHDVTDPQVLRAVVNAGHQLHAKRLDAADAGREFDLAGEVAATVDWWLADQATAGHFRARPPRAS